MARQRLIPEEELLKLIEKGDDAETVRFKRKRGLFLSFGRLKNFWLFLSREIKQSVDRFKSGIREPNLKVLNKAFLVIGVVLLTYSITDFLVSRPDIKEVYRKSRLMKKRKPLRKATEELRPFLHYLEVVRRRDIFSPVVLKETEKPEAKKKRLQEMIKDLRLVGIAWDDKKPVAMIEDKKEKKTYFLEEGQMINKLKLEDILEDRVILNFKGEKIELL